MTDPNPLYCSAEMAQVVLEGAHEVLACEEIEVLIKEAGISLPGAGAKWTMDQFEAVISALDKRHGRLGARGISLRIGRASFPGFVRTFGSEDGFEDADYRLLPVRKRARAGLDKFATIFACACNLKISVASEPEAWTWTLVDCPQCSDPLIESTISHFMLGLLQQYLGWISGGKVFLVEEAACQSEGAPNCVIRISRLPLE